MSTKISPEERIGQVYNGMKIVNIERKRKKFKFICKCECGYERKVLTNNLNKVMCRYCSVVNKYKNLIGTKKGKLILIDICMNGLACKFKVKCNCGNIYHMKPYLFTHAKSCCKCRKGYSIGHVFPNGITLVEYLGDKLYKMKCHCGVLYNSVIRSHNGKQIDCGCTNKNKILEKAKEKIGEIYGHLKVTKLLGNLDGHYIYEMKCKCGNKILKRGGHFNKSKSCGCLLKENLPVGENAKNAKLKDIDVKSARDMYESGNYSIEELSSIINVDKNYLKRILKKDIWKNV